LAFGLDLAGQRHTDPVLLPTAPWIYIWPCSFMIWRQLVCLNPVKPLVSKVALATGRNNQLKLRISPSTLRSVSSYWHSRGHSTGAWERPNSFSDTLAIALDNIRPAERVVLGEGAASTPDHGLSEFLQRTCGKIVPFPCPSLTDFKIGIRPIERADLQIW